MPSVRVAVDEAVKDAAAKGGQLGALAALACSLADDIDAGDADRGTAPLAKELRATLERIGDLDDGDDAARGLAGKLGQAD